MNIGKMFNHEIVIQPSSNYGFVVRIGCGLFVYEDKRSMLNDLETYLENPKKAENEYKKSCTTLNPTPAGHNPAPQSVPLSTTNTEENEEDTPF